MRVLLLDSKREIPFEGLLQAELLTKVLLLHRNTTIPAELFEIVLFSIRESLQLLNKI